MNRQILSVAIFIACFGLYSFQLCQFEANIDYFGNDINATFPLTQDACCQLCQNTVECQAWTYLPQTQYCWIKRNIGSLRIPSAGRNSGVKIQTAAVVPVVPLPTAAPGVVATRQAGCFIENDVNYPANDLPITSIQLNVLSAVDCCNICGANPSCLAFVYSLSDRFCWLKSATNAPANRQPYVGLISGIVTQR